MKRFNYRHPLSARCSQEYLILVARCSGLSYRKIEDFFGYSRNTIPKICTPAVNYAKHDKTVEEFLQVCKDALEGNGYIVRKEDV